MDINKISTYISLVSGIMTILGISGIISWSFKNRDKKGLSDTVISIFANSIKFFISMVLFALISGLCIGANLFIVVMFKGSVSSGTPLYWEKGYEIQHLLTYLFIGSLAIPIFLILSACIYQWSLNPLRVLLNRFKNK